MNKISYTIRLFAQCLCLTLAVLGYRASAQIIIWSEGFEGDFPGPWITGDANPDGGTSTFWAPVNEGFGGEDAHTGNRMGYSAGTKYPANSTEPSPVYDLNMISFMEREINLSTYRTARLDFWYKIRMPQDEFGGYLTLFVDGNYVYGWNPSYPFTDEWKAASVDLSAFTGGTHTLRFESRTIDYRPPAEEGVYLDDIVLTGELPSEFTVFGTGERTQLVNSVTSPLTKLVRPSVLPEFFNNTNQTTHSVSLISPGEMVIDQYNDREALYQTYFTGSRKDIKEMEIMAERLVIRSPLILKSTHVKIYARELRFERDSSTNGLIITTGSEDFPFPVAATGPNLNQKGSDGTNGVSAGSVEVFVQQFNDATGNNKPKFVLTGGKGQAAGKGKHGGDGSVLFPGDEPHGWTNDEGQPYGRFVFGNASWTLPEGYLVTYVHYDDDNTSQGYSQWPTDGTNAWRAGTPGKGGNGGTLTTSYPYLSGVYGGGQPGAIGATDDVPSTPGGQPGHYSPYWCEGGYAGLPQQAIHLHAWTTGNPITGYTYHIAESARRTSANGVTYPVPFGRAGTNGTRQVSGSSYSWLHPTLLRKIINVAKDDYLQNRLTTAQARLKDYAGIVESFRADTNAWNAVPPSETDQLELNQMYAEMQLLLQQMANGLDYFGNPAGWVPMLSFEVSLNVFDQEIDRSLDIIYLSQWLAEKQDNAAATVAALGTARSELADEINSAKASYAAATANLSGLEGEAVLMSQRVQNLLGELEARENDLHAQAVENNRPSEWESAVRTGLGVAGVICQVIPVYQPALGQAGNALSAASGASSVEDVFAALGSSGVPAAAAEQQTQTENLDVGALLQKTNRIAQLKELGKAGVAMADGMKKISGVLESSQAPSSEIEADLDRLLRTDPQYTQLVKDIRQLMQDKRQVADKIITAIQQVGGLSDQITRDILAMDAFSDAIQANASILDPRANAYLKDMERRAFDRLLKYHYYMAKAYEYRLVRPYNAQLNLEELFNKMQAIAQAGTNAASKGALTGDQRDLLKGVFKDLIATTTEEIYTDYQDNPSELGSSFTFDLTPAELAALNRGEAITLNLVNRGFFLADEENVRIADLRVFANAPGGIGTTGSYGSPAYVDLSIEHSGLSNVKLAGQVYQFRHYNQNTRNAITWKSRYEPVPNILSPTPLIASDASLLRSLLPQLNTADLLLYSRPSAWADLKVWRSGNNGGATFGLGDSNAPITLTKVTLQVSYDRVIRTDSPIKRRNLEVLVAQVDDAQGASHVDDNLTPSFAVSASDVNGRQDGYGHFLRIYGSTPATVQVTAQEFYGSLGFYRWTDSGGTVLSSNPTISVSTTADKRIVAQYLSLLPIPLTMNMNMAGGPNTLSWQGGVGVRLQTRACLSAECPWQDVPGTEGMSSFTLTPAQAGSSFFRLVRVR